MTSINYPQMYNRDDFTPQHITVTDGDYLILWLDDLNLPPPLTQPDAPLEANSLMTSCSEYIRVYEVDADQTSHDMAILCGNIDQFDSLSRSIISLFGKDVYIDMNFEPEASSFNGRGYRILYTAGYLDCKNETVIDVQDIGLVASLQFPHNRCTNINKFLHSEVSRFEITVLYFDGGPTCQRPRTSYLDMYIYSGLCGGRIADFPQITFIRQLLYLNSLAANFLLKYKTPEVEFNNNILIDTIEVDYDAIEEGSTCEWKIQMPQNTLVMTSIRRFEEYAPSPDYCTYHGLHLIDGSGTLLHYTCPSTNYFATGALITSLSNVTYVRLVNASRETNLDFRFNIRHWLTRRKSLGTPSIEFKCYNSIIETSIPTVVNSPITTSAPFDPIITGISPDIGILAGGTRLTLSGQNFIPGIVLMSYGDYVTASSEPCTHTTCFVMTSPGKLADAGIKVPISLTFPGLEPISTSFTFTYKPNPQVNSIHPLKTLVAGGTTLTVQGEGFDAVNEPHLLVHVVHTISGQFNETQNETTFTSLCAVNASDTLKCPTPKLEIPDQFKHIADKKIMPNDYQNNRSKTDDDATADFTWNIEGESLDFYLGIKLDGDQTYTELSVSLPEYSQIKVYILEPEFDRFTETREVSSKDHLQITGKRLTDGLDITDYAVKVGTRTCDVIDLTVNELVCVILAEEGQKEEDEHSVLVHPGTNLSPQYIGNSRTK